MQARSTDLVLEFALVTAYVATILSAEHCGPVAWLEGFMSRPILAIAAPVRRW
jgi:hypothetical protein